MSNEESQEEVVEEEVSEESTEEQPSEEAVEQQPISTEETTQNECIVLPEHTKPIVECCKEYDEGKIDSGDFFSKTLINIGKFMEAVSKKKESGESE